MTLDCDIDNVGKFTVGWQKSNRERSQNVNTISLGPTLAVAEERFNLSDDKENNTMKYRLTVGELQFSVEHPHRARMSRATHQLCILITPLE